MTIAPTFFYFAPDDLMTPGHPHNPHSENRAPVAIVVGGTISCVGDVVPCENGMHASEHVLDAATFRRDGLLTLCEIADPIEHGGDKVAGRSRTTLAILDRKATDRVMREIAAMAAELAVQWGSVDTGIEIDQRVTDAIDAARLFARGEISDAAAAAAAAAAWAAARAAARAAIHDVADRMAREALTGGA